MANTRNLKSSEIELLAKVFVKTLPFDRVIITDKLGIDDRPYTLPMLVKKNYHVNVGSAYHRDMSKDDEDQYLLIHECTHVWQGVHGLFEWDYVINSGCSQLFSAFKKGTAYDYSSGQSWSKYNAEQQASIVERWFAEGMLVSNDNWSYVRDNIREPGYGGKAYFFKEAQYLRWSIGDGVDSGYPKGISDNWNDFVKGARAGFSRLEGEEEYYYFFKGDEYTKWKPGSGTLDGYPKKISGNWKSSFMVDGLDAVLNVDTNRVYFFKGDEYIRYTLGEGQDTGYPKKISDTFESSFIKNGFDTCVYWGNGKAYFFKDDEYIRYTIGSGVDSGYPKKIGETWNSDMKNSLRFALLKRKDVF